jgi:hypothetical protein
VISRKRYFSHSWQSRVTPIALGFATNPNGSESSKTKRLMEIKGDQTIDLHLEQFLENPKPADVQMHLHRHSAKNLRDRSLLDFSELVQHQ